MNNGQRTARWRTNGQMAGWLDAWPENSMPPPHIVGRGIQSNCGKICKYKPSFKSLFSVQGKTAKFAVQEADLEIVRQFLPPGVSWVHCDEDSAGRVQHQLCSFEEESRHSLVDSNLNTLNLLCYHWQHLQLNAVELVEAWPSTRLGKTLEELAHGLVVKALRAVEHHTLDHTTVHPRSPTPSGQQFTKKCKKN